MWVWVMARVLAGCDTVRIKSGHTVHDCGENEDIWAANANFLVKRYIGSFKKDPSWSFAGIVCTVVREMSLKISRMKAYKGL
ncbi:hypothetical protein LINGRAHAP2_LOCUS10500 [Linum grandiflorum]